MVEVVWFWWQGLKIKVGEFKDSENKWEDREKTEKWDTFFRFKK